MQEVYSQGESGAKLRFPNLQFNITRLGGSVRNWWMSPNSVPHDLLSTVANREYRSCLTLWEHEVNMTGTVKSRGRGKSTQSIYFENVL
jgi:hypothetical protein